MKVLVFSDLHFFHTRSSYLLETCRWIADEIERTTPDLVVFGGDANHTHDYIDIETLEALTRGFSEIISRLPECADFVVIPGNHDQASSDGKQTVLSIFRGHTRVSVMDTPSCSSCGRFVFAPYPPTAPKQLEDYTSALQVACLRAREKCSDLPILISHWELKDVPYKPGDTPRGTRGRIAEGFKLVVNGHYHHPVYYPSLNGCPVLLVGSPCYHNYSDSIVEEPRGVLLLADTEDVGTSRVACPGWWYGRLENPHGPIYHTVKAEDLPSFGAASATSLSKRLKLRVVVSSVEAYEELRPKLAALQDAVESLRVSGVPSATSSSSSMPMATPGFDVRATVESYVADYANPCLPREVLLDLGLKLIEESGA